MKANVQVVAHARRGRARADGVEAAVGDLHKLHRVRRVALALFNLRPGQPVLAQLVGEELGGAGFGHGGVALVELARGDRNGRVVGVAEDAVGSSGGDAARHQRVDGRAVALRRLDGHVDVGHARVFLVPVDRPEDDRDDGALAARDVDRRGIERRPNLAAATVSVS